MNKLSVIIITLNEEKNIGKILNCLKKQTYIDKAREKLKKEIENSLIDVKFSYISLNENTLKDIKTEKKEYISDGKALIISY